MKKQWLTAAAGVALVMILFFFGRTVAHKTDADAAVIPEIAFDIQQYTDSLAGTLPESQSAWYRGFFQNMPADSMAKAAAYYHLATFWKDSAKQSVPYLYYISKASQLENSEKSLTFAAHLMLDNLRMQQNEQLLGWMHGESVALFEQALAINPGNDDNRIGLGSTYIYGKGRYGDASQTMKGIQEVLTVARRDSTNMKAQLILGVGGMVSGQFDKARDRFLTVISNEPNNLEAIAYLADTYAALGEKQEAIRWYNKSKELVNNPHYSKEVDQRIKQLK